MKPIEIYSQQKSKREVYVAMQFTLLIAVAIICVIALFTNNSQYLLALFFYPLFFVMVMASYVKKPIFQKPNKEELSKILKNVDNTSTLYVDQSVFGTDSDVECKKFCDDNKLLCDNLNKWVGDDNGFKSITQKYKAIGQSATTMEVLKIWRNIHNNSPVKVDDEFVSDSAHIDRDCMQFLSKNSISLHSLSRLNSQRPSLSFYEGMSQPEKTSYFWSKKTQVLLCELASNCLIFVRDAGLKISVGRFISQKGIYYQISLSFSDKKNLNEYEDDIIQFANLLSDDYGIMELVLYTNEITNINEKMKSNHIVLDNFLELEDAFKKSEAVMLLINIPIYNEKKSV